MEVGKPEAIRSLALLATLNVRHLPQLCAKLIQIEIVSKVHGVCAFPKYLLGTSGKLSSDSAALQGPPTL
jgi:hypothetical protein